MNCKDPFVDFNLGISSMDEDFLAIVIPPSVHQYFLVDLLAAGHRVLQAPIKT